MAKIDLRERPERREELASWYCEALADQELSGLSVAEYAAALGVTPATLYHWKRRVWCKVREREHTVTRAASNGLIRVSLEKRPSGEESDGFVVRLAGERCVEVPCNFDDAALERLLVIVDRC